MQVRKKEVAKMPKMICKHPSCNILVEKGKKYCDIHMEVYEQNKKDSHKWYKKNRKDYWEQRFYNSKVWIKMGELIRERDMYVCQLCLKDKHYGSDDVVHHIIELKEDRRLSLDSNNLICLCDSCHRKVHAIYKYKKKHMQNNLRELAQKKPLVPPSL